MYFMFSKLLRKFCNFLLIPVVFRNWPQVMAYVFLIFLLNGRYKDRIGKVILRNGQFLKIRLNIYDIGSVIETNFRGVYTLPSINIPEDAKILDIGASIGDFGVFCATAFKNAEIFCYEPMSEAFELLKENIRLNKFEKQIKSYNLAVSGVEGELRFGIKTYPAVTLKQVFDHNKIGRCDLLKMDIEGAEYPVLMSAPIEILRTINAIAMECHIQEGNVNDLCLLTKHLADAGFNVNRTKINVHNICYLYAIR